MFWFIPMWLLALVPAIDSIGTVKNRSIGCGCASMRFRVLCVIPIDQPMDFALDLSILAVARLGLDCRWSRIGRFTLFNR